jgi:hypothetical protein
MANAMYAETLDDSQHSSRLILKSRSCALNSSRENLRTWFLCCIPHIKVEYIGISWLLGARKVLETKFCREQNNETWGLLFLAQMFNHKHVPSTGIGAEEVIRNPSGIKWNQYYTKFT